jgi:hypothetical protein
LESTVRIRRLTPSSAFGLGLLASLLLTGCSNAGGTSCEEFNAQSITTQSETLSDLLSEHDLDPTDFGNIQGVTAAVSSLCSSGSSATLDEATDWESDTW